MAAVAAFACLGCAEPGRSSPVDLDECARARCGAAAVASSADADGDGGLGIVLTLPFALVFVVGLRGRPHWGQVAAAGMPRTVEQPTSEEPRMRLPEVPDLDATAERTLQDRALTRRASPPS